MASIKHLVSSRFVRGSTLNVSFVLIAIVMTTVVMSGVASGAAHKKPPFNGSIFGKRSMGSSSSSLGRTPSSWSPTLTSSRGQIDDVSQRESFGDIISSIIDDYLASAANNEMYDTLGFCEAIIANCRALYGINEMNNAGRSAPSAPAGNGGGGGAGQRRRRRR